MSTAELREMVAANTRAIAELRDAQELTDKQVRAATLAVERMSGSIGREWGNLVESLTKAACLDQLRAAGIEVTQTALETESERPGYEQEWDVVLLNGDTLVAIEVKSRLRESDLRRVQTKLKGFKSAFPQYKGYAVLGGVAAIRFDAHSDRAAEKAGLFVFRPGGGVMTLANREGFRPKAW